MTQIDSETVVRRPKRWDQQFSEEMTQLDCEMVLASHHFASMNADGFPAHLPLDKIVFNDCRVRRFEADDLIVHAGAYLNSGFIILKGQASLVLAPGIDPSAWGYVQTSKRSIFHMLRKWIGKSKRPEVRSKVASAEETESFFTPSAIKIDQLSTRAADTGAQITVLKEGDVFAESAVLSRNIMPHTVVAKGELTVLEIRWQGLRDISKSEPAFKAHFDKMYRERGLLDHLTSVPLFKNVSEAQMTRLTELASFEVHGEFDWQRQFQKVSEQAEEQQDLDLIIEAEPVIAAEGDYPDGLLLIRNGFTRLSRKINNGHYTLGHLGSGSLFGLEELVRSWQTGDDSPLACSLRALGYTDIIRIPTHWLEENCFRIENESLLKEALPNEISMAANSLPQSANNEELRTKKSPTAKLNLEPGDSAAKSSAKKTKPIERELTEFLVENRVINGTETMMIDLERCVRCDDCVTACANAHDDNPRFNRHGPRFGRYMIANACMHCDDPACMIGCPTGAIHRTESGVVTINDQTCIGCSSCANSCPYDNIRMVEIRDEKGLLLTDEKAVPIQKATKCDLCSNNPGGPACERACPHDALVRIDVKDISKLADWIDR